MNCILMFMTIQSVLSLMINRYMFVKNAIQFSAIPKSMNQKDNFTTSANVQQEHNKVIFECKITNTACESLQAALITAGQENIEVQRQFNVEEPPPINLIVIMKSEKSEMMWSMVMSSNSIEIAENEAY